MGKFKIVVIGNGGVGKTSLICRWMGVDIFPELYIPSVLEPVTVPVPLPLDTMQVSGSSNATTTKLQAELEIWDTPGQDDWNQSWPQAFRNAHCVVICFSIGWEVSLECVEEKATGVAQQINAMSYLECSAKTWEGVREVLDEIALTVWVGASREKARAAKKEDRDGVVRSRVRRWREGAKKLFKG
ncbi:neuronal RhoA GEF protein, variant 2 [Coprinopsis cinerea AmutBmut pab1-1]|nr:neuronal RhoA GEF protein, variant 2 [Coprinopsis cinerea AmutBmut pab1-1]